MMKKRVIALILLLLVAVSCCSLALAGCNDGTQIEEAEIQVQKTPSAQDGWGNALFDGEEYTMPSNMKFMSTSTTASEEGILITAVYSPGNTSNQKTDWSVSFADPSSSWAQNKNPEDYVEVTPKADNTASVKCLRPFGEQIIITATSQAYASVSDTTTVDYERKIEDRTFTLYADGSPVSSVKQSEIESNSYDKTYFDITYKEPSPDGLDSMIEPYWDITVKMDFDAADIEYSLGVTTEFSEAFTIDKEYPFYSVTDATEGAQYTPIEGAAESGLEKENFVASSYYIDGYGISNETIAQAYNYVLDFIKNPSQNNALKVALMASDVDNWETAGEGIQIGIVNLRVKSFYENTVQSYLFENDPDYFDQGWRDQFADYLSNNLPDVTSGALYHYIFYSGKIIRISRSIANAKEYFTENEAVSYRKFMQGGVSYRIAFRFNPDSLGGDL